MVLSTSQSWLSAVTASSALPSAGRPRERWRSGLVTAPIARSRSARNRASQRPTVLTEGAQPVSARSDRRACSAVRCPPNSSRSAASASRAAGQDSIE